jgi:hypothetical protein
MHVLLLHFDNRPQAIMIHRAPSRNNTKIGYFCHIIASSVAPAGPTRQPTFGSIKALGHPEAQVERSC